MTMCSCGAHWNFARWGENKVPVPLGAAFESVGMLQARHGSVTDAD